jgi:uncharacterized protein (TIRG00374 family)
MSETTERRRRRWQLPKRLKHLIQILLALFVLNTFVLPQLAGTRDALNLIGDLNPFLLIAGAAAEVASLMAVAHLVRTLLPLEDRPPSWTVNRIVLAARGASRVVPGGAAAGGVLTYRLLRRVGVPTSQAGFSVATQSLESAAVLVAILFVAMVISIPLTGLNVAYLIVASVVAVLLAGVGWLVVTVTRDQSRSISVARRFADWIRVLDPDRVEGLLRTLGARIDELTKEPKELARHVGWSAAYWLLDAVALAIFLAAYGHWTRPDALLVAFCVANVAAVVPITPGGLGVMEVTLSAALVGFGVDSGVALLGVVSWRLVNYWLPIPAGAAAYLSLRLGEADRPATEELEELTDEARVEAGEILPWRRGRRGRPGQGSVPGS